MAHSLIRIKGSLVNTPHLIEQNSFNSIMEYVDKRIAGNAEILPKMMEDDEEDYQSPKWRYNSDTRTGVMHIDGAITYKSTGWEALCGGTSCQMLKEQMEYFAEKGAKTVAMIVSSGGGEAHELFSSANYLRKIADENGIKIVAMIDGMSASAAYGLTVIADEVISSADSLTGSIGVLIQLINSSKALEKEGYERVFVTSSDGKIPYDKEGGFREEFLSDLQKQVDTLYENFVSHVAEYRNISKQTVIDTDAKVFMAKEALELGLIDKILSIEEFYDYLADYAQSNLEENEMGMNPLKNLINMKSKEDKAEMAKIQEMEAMLQAKEAELSASLEQVSMLTASLAEMQEQFESLQAFAEEHKAAAEAAKAEAERVAQEAAEQKIAQRKAALAEVLPADQVEATYEALASLEDASFNVIVAQHAAIKAARAEEFKALGNEGVEREEEATTEQGSLEAIRQAGVERARARYKK